MKRIIMMLSLAAFLVAALSVSAFTAFAAPSCEQVPNNPNCVVTGPGNSENTPAKEHNPNVKSEFKPGTPGGR
jgi:hypothetical protein